MKSSSYFLILLTMAWVFECKSQTNPATIPTPQPKIATTFAITNPASGPTTANLMLSNSAVSNPSLPAEISALNTEMSGLKVRVESNEKSVDRYFAFVAIIFAFVAIIFGVGTLASFVGWLRTEQRAKETHNLAITYERVTQARETTRFEQSQKALVTSDQREASLFDQSQKTLTLVNETLGLAKEASARASKSLENKLRKTLRDLTKNSVQLIEKAEAYVDDKNLVAKKETTSQIHSLGNKIKGLENNMVILEDSAIEIEPHCSFVSAIDSYLHEDYSEAIEQLENTALQKDTPIELKSLSNYWLGYIHNNLREFDEAILRFRKALELASGTRKYELRRILIESRFFNREDSIALVAEMRVLLEEFYTAFPDKSTKDVVQRGTKMENTLGNIYFQLGNETGERKFYELAREQFKKVYDPSKPDKWVLFGLAEALYKLGETKEAAEILKTKVVREAEKEYLTREELRTKVLAKTTLLICAIRANSPRSEIKDCRDEVISLLGNVDNRLTIYSQLQRRNVAREEFVRDIDILMAEAGKGGSEYEV